MKEIKPLIITNVLCVSAMVAFAGFMLTSFSSAAILLAASLSIAKVGIGMVMPVFQAITINSVSKDEPGAAAERKDCLPIYYR